VPAEGVGDATERIQARDMVTTFQTRNHRLGHPELSCQLLLGMAGMIPFFISPAAQAFGRDIPSAKVIFYDAGYFALETHVEEISDQIRSLLMELVQGGKF
jgi:hypothetical protein